MGRWGEGLFQGDTDLDVASYISEDAEIELYSYEIETNSKYECVGKGLQVTRDHLNNGVLSRLFKQYSTQKNFHHGMVSKELSIVFLAALAMRVGATIEPQHMELVRNLYTKIPVSPKYSLPLFDSHFRALAKRQCEIALAHYKNDGTPYNFYAARCELAGCEKADDELREGQRLMKCGKCKETFYCTKECQMAHWKAHKKNCKTPEQRKKEEERMRRGRIHSLNV